MPRHDEQERFLTEGRFLLATRPRYRIRKHPIAAALATGAFLEIVLFVLSVPRDSTKPASPLEQAALSAPFPGMLFFLGVMSGPTESVPEPVAAIAFVFGIAFAFLFQAALLGSPVWVAMWLWKRFRA